MISVADIVDQIINYVPRIGDSFDRDTDYWNEYYSQKLEELQKPSDFAVSIKKYLKSGKK